MFTYPKLTAAEQASLPTLLTEPHPISAKFEDSTHQLFDCQTTHGRMVLKVCHETNIAASHFWSGANHLFAADFPGSLGNIHLTHRFLIQHGALGIPDCVAAGAHRFVLSRFVPGEDLDAGNLTEHWVIKLASHIAKLHQYTYANWGAMNAPAFTAKQWAGRLRETLVLLLKQHGMPMTDPIVADALARTEMIHEVDFIPMMLDLRWDQFRCSDMHVLTLIDLDAFVIAPRALDLLLIEYVLTPAQLALFKQHYTHTWPAHTENTPSYQLLLFLMNVLGETDLATWMQLKQLVAGKVSPN